MVGKRRPRGTGHVYEKHGSWYGRWWTPSGGQANRKIGPMRQPGSRDGLTRVQAERRLQRMIDGEGTPTDVSTPGRTVAAVGAMTLAQLEAGGRKSSHTESFESHLRVHISDTPLGRTLIDRADDRDIERFMAALRSKHVAPKKSGAADARNAKTLAPKTVKNIMGTVHAVFEYARRKKWIAANPCQLVEKPATQDSDPDIRFLTLDELEAVLRAVPQERSLTWEKVDHIRCSAASNMALADELGVSDSLVSRVRRGLIWNDRSVIKDKWEIVDPPLILMAAMTGMRQGELLALRWRDIDWVVQKIRVRQNYVRGQFGTPKSKRSTRGVPLATRLAGAIDDLHRSTAYNGDDDLVFAHPETGTPLDRSQVLKRLKRYCRRAGVRDVRFHDLRHTFGTTMAAKGVAMRRLQEWMGHRDIKTTQIYADYAPAANEAELVDDAFMGALADGEQTGEQTEQHSGQLNQRESA